jgi:hypothetical protein
VLDPDRTLRTLVLVLHEEPIEQYPGMAYYGGVFSEGEVSVRAIYHVPEHPFPVRTTLDLVGQWRLRGLTRFSIVHMIVSICRQCFGY